MSFKYQVLLAIIVLIEINSSFAKGPHHPRNSHIIKRDTRKEEFNEHLNHKDNE